MSHHAFGVPTINECCFQYILNKRRVIAPTHLPTLNVPVQHTFIHGHHML